MARPGLLGFCMLAVFLSLVQTAVAEPIGTMSGVGSALISCWSAPEDAGRSAVTLRFGFKRDGTLIGPPRATAVDVSGNADLRRRFVDAAIDAVQRCTPIALSPNLAQGMGGRVFTMRFSSPDYQVGRSLATPQ